MSFLVDQPILLLFAVVGIGSLIGRIRIGGFALGPAAVLFTGLAASGLDHRLVLDEQIQVLGLVLFTYVVGVSAGPAFVSSLRGRGLRSVALVATMISAAVAIAVALRHVVDLQSGRAAGVFTGALTNTPALGAVIDHVNSKQAANAAVGYSLAYPIGVLGALVAAHLALRSAGPNAAAETGGTRSSRAPGLVAWTVRIREDGLPRLGELQSYGGGLAFGHHARGDQVDVASADITLEPGDVVTVVGPEARVRAFSEDVGTRVPGDLGHDRSELDIRRMVVSSRKVAGRTLGSLDLGGRFGASATRVRRGDVDLLGLDDLVIELGDRLRIVAPTGRFADIAAFLGDSENRVAEVDFVTTAFGIAAGLALGAVKWPGGLQLGAAGGALIAGLVLGGIQRVGPILFSIGHQASLTLRQLGTVIFLAAVGTRAGATLADSAISWDGLKSVLVGLVITTVAMAMLLVLAPRWCALHGRTLAGGIAGAQTQPAVLAFAEEKTAGDTRVAFGYTTLYPAAMVLKIVAAQLLVSI